MRGVSSYVYHISDGCINDYFNCMSVGQCPWIRARWPALPCQCQCTEYRALATLCISQLPSYTTTALPMTRTSVTVVCRERPATGALPHVVQLLDDLLGPPQRWLPLEARLRHLMLLKRLRRPVSSEAKWAALRQAALENNPRAMDKLRASLKYPSTWRGGRDVMSRVVARGHVETADWIHAY